MSYVTKRKRSSSQNRLPYNVSLGAALMAGLAPGAAAAENPGQAPTTALDPIEVKAERLSTVGDYKQEHLASPRFTQPVSETPQTIQIISEDLIEDQHATTLTEALKYTAGVGTFNMGEASVTNTGDNIYMRGFDVSSSIFVDGIRDVASIHRDTFNIQQIEVIKGSNGTNYGRSAPGGSINMVTKKAHLGDTGEITMTIGTGGQRRATLDINRQITETAAVRLNLMWQNSDVPGRDFLENNRWGIAPAVSFGLGTDTRWHINYYHVQQNNVPGGGVPTIGLPNYQSDKAFLASAPQPDSDNFYGTAKDYEDIQVDRATVIFEHDFNDQIRFRNILRWTRIHQEYLLSSIYVYDRWRKNEKYWKKTPPSQWKLYREPNLKNVTHTALTNKASIVQEIKTGGVAHTLSYGLVLRHETIETHEMEIVGAGSHPYPGTVSVYNPSHPADFSIRETGAEQQSTVDTAAIYLFDTMQLTDKWQVNAGVRLDHYRIESGGVSYNENLFSWQLGAVYQLNQHGNVYVNYAVSKQPPGSSSLTLATSGYAPKGSPNNPIYEPREARTAEIGTKWTLADGDLLLTAAVYRTVVENLIEQDSSGDYYQIGEKRVRGIELYAVGQITPNWNVTAGFTTLDSEVTQGLGRSESITGGGLPYTPSIAFTSWTTYRLPFGLTIGGGIRYTGEREAASSWSGHYGLPTVDDYWVVDVMAEYQLGPDTSIQLNVYNVLDQEYVASINTSGDRYVPGQPRTAVVSLNYRF